MTPTLDKEAVRRALAESEDASNLSDERCREILHTLYAAAQAWLDAADGMPSGFMPVDSSDQERASLLNDFLKQIKQLLKLA